MKQTFISAAFAAALLGAAPADAQNLAADLLPPYEVATIVTSMGMRPIDRPIWRNGRYVVHAIDRDGREVRVVLDARDGHVLAVRPRERDLGYEPRYAPPPGYARPAPYDRRFDAPSPPPPAAVRGAPPIDDDDEFFDDDRQQGSLMPPAEPPSVIPAPRQQSSRDAPPRSAAVAPVERAPAKMPLPRSRPENLSATPADDAQPTGSVAATPEGAAGEKKSDAPKEASRAVPDAKKKDIRIIEIAKPKAAKVEDKPGEPIRF